VRNIVERASGDGGELLCGVTGAGDTGWGDGGAEGCVGGVSGSNDARGESIAVGTGPESSAFAAGRGGWSLTRTARPGSGSGCVMLDAGNVPDSAACSDAMTIAGGGGAIHAPHSLQNRACGASAARHCGHELIGVRG
jgi:hypothetical protein